MTGNGKRKNPADSTGTDGAIDGQSLTGNFTNRVSRATRAAEQAKQEQIAATKQAETSLVVATPSTVPPAARVTRLSTQLAARSQAPLPPDTTSEAIAIRPQTVKSLCISVIPGPVTLTHTVLEDL